MAEPTGLTDLEGQEIDSNWDEVPANHTTFLTVLQVVDNFDNMGLKAELLRGVYAYGMLSMYALSYRRF